MTADSQWTPSQLWQGTTAEKDLEASTEIPEVLTNAPTTDTASANSKPPPREDSGPAFRGAWAGSDIYSIRLRPDSQDAEILPPERGYIHISRRGDLKRMQRRHDARTLIAPARHPYRSSPSCLRIAPC